MISVYEDDS